LRRFGNVSKCNVTLVRHERLGNNICNGDRSTVVVCVLCPTLREKWFRVRRLPTDLLFYSRQSRWLIVKDVEVMQRVNTPRALVHLVNEMFCVTRIAVRAVCRYGETDFVLKWFRLQLSSLHSARKLSKYAYALIITANIHARSKRCLYYYQHLPQYYVVS
jgi:hypothetical protein